DRVAVSLRDLAPGLCMARIALAATLFELQVLLPGERAERPGVRAGPPFAATFDVEALPIPCDLAGERCAGGQGREQRGRDDRAHESSDHPTPLLRPEVGLAIGRHAPGDRSLRVPCRGPPAVLPPLSVPTIMSDRCRSVRCGGHGSGAAVHRGVDAWWREPKARTLTHRDPMRRGSHNAETIASLRDGGPRRGGGQRRASLGPNEPSDEERDDRPI